ncbi:pre-mRNA-processing 40A-like isoform X1 [Olea europaea subsp. europaea]|uniref:Pre-mRNA-processing 40A-like isoform X1 n=1 Tax=Olea europaea subsp. europaea TaxID=158383 RepID=A0A8S0V2W4_OLEEU|nr:pre-mRNA-processing 40A-like isoform X1 [Olea europaea subsp. europaea]
MDVGEKPFRPRMISPIGPTPSPVPPISMQFRPVVPPPPQPYLPMPSQQFQPVGLSNVGMPSHPSHIQFPQPVPPPPERPGLGGHVLPQPQPIPPPNFQPNNFTSVPPQHQHHVPISSNFMPNFGGPRIPLSSSYNLSSSSSGSQQTNADSATQHQPMSQTNNPSFPAGGQPWFPIGNQNIPSVMPSQQSGEQSAGEQPWYSTGDQNVKSVTASGQTGEQNSGGQFWFSGNQNMKSGTPEQTREQSAGIVNSEKIQPDPVEKASSVWIQHTARNGKKYYYSRRTGLSTWEKPVELMTEIERADASTDWREFTTPEGRKFYYNNVTKKSKWAIPDELQLARKRAKVDSYEGTPTVKDVNSNSSADVAVSGVKASNHNANNSPFPADNVESIPIPVSLAVNPQCPVTFGSSGIPLEFASEKADATGLQTTSEATTVTAVSDTAVTTQANTPIRTSDNTPSQDAPTSTADATSPGNIEEAMESEGISGSGSINVPEEKNEEQGPIVYESKLEAKNAFKVLLETANVGPDWTWDQAMRAIINDRRYGALRTLGERKQAFNEFMGQKKKQEAEERRARQKKAREDFKKMLEESKDLTSSIRWSKAISIFENDERFKAVERAKDREDLLKDFMEELGKKERAKALEEHKHHRVEYIEFLKSCDFIKASSQWRKVQDRLEADERCSRLEKIERLEIFQEYIRDLEKEEEEQRKLRMEEMRKAERKNRDEFRKLMHEHVANGILSAKTHWRDYCIKVKDSPAYLEVSSNTSGSTAKDLFEDVIEDLGKQYDDDKLQIKDEIKMKKISLSSTSTLEDFKAAILEDISSPGISDINLRLIFDELLERAKEKEEKEAKKRKRLADDLYDFLYSSKEITASSRWEDCKSLVEDRFTGDEGFFQEIFDEVIAELKEKSKEKERKRKEEKAKKEKERKDKEKRKEREKKSREKGVDNRKVRDRVKKDGTESDESESYSLEERRRSGRDKDKKHGKRHRDSFDDNEKDWFNPHRRSVEHKKSKQTSDTDSESQHKRHRRDRKHSYRSSDAEEHKEMELGEDGEVR